MNYSNLLAEAMLHGIHVLVSRALLCVQVWSGIEETAWSLIRSQTMF